MAGVILSLTISKSLSVSSGSCSGRTAPRLRRRSDQLFGKPARRESRRAEREFLETLRRLPFNGLTHRKSPSVRRNGRLARKRNRPGSRKSRPSPCLARIARGFGFRVHLRVFRACREVFSGRYSDIRLRRGKLSACIQRGSDARSLVVPVDVDWRSHENPVAVVRVQHRRLPPCVALPASSSR